MPHFSRLTTLAALILASVLRAQVSVPQVLTVDQIRQLETQVSQHPDHLASVRLLGANYAFVILGVTALNRLGIVEKRDLALTVSEFAGHAQEVLNESQVPALLGEGAQALVRHRFGGTPLLPRELREDAEKLAGQVLNRAIVLDPKQQEFRQQRIELTISNSTLGRLPIADGWSKVKEDIAAMTGAARYYALAHVAAMAFRAGKTDEATELAHELRNHATAEAGGNDWNHGNAIHAANVVLGRVELSRGNIAGAEAHLLRSASEIPNGSPQLNSFGPNMSLAAELLRAGHPKAVLEYFSLCRGFWKRGGPFLDKWAAEVDAGRTPDFGPNLNY